MYSGPFPRCRSKCGYLRKAGVTSERRGEGHGFGDFGCPLFRKKTFRLLYGVKYGTCGGAFALLRFPCPSQVPGTPQGQREPLKGRGTPPMVSKCLGQRSAFPWYGSPVIHGFGNFGAGNYLGRLDSGGHGRPWAREATGGHGRPREAMGSVTLGLGITSAGWALEITLGLESTFLKL